MDIQGKTALVTGGAKRVGRQIALGLAEKGAHLILHFNRSAAEAEKTASEIRTLGVSCRLAQADLSKSSEICTLVSGLEAEGSPLDILVNSASLFYKTPLKSAQESDWDSLMNANLKGPFILSTKIGLRMAQNAGGKIINIADWSGLRPYKDYAPYCTSKGGLIALTKALARDLAPKVMVNAVAPGPVLPPPDMPEAESHAAIQKTLLGRWGSPKDVANAVCFLIENDFMNGTVLCVDGGRSIV